MKQRSRINIHTPAEELWAWLVEPEFIAEWNNKLLGAQPLQPTPPQLNSRYRFTYRLSGSEQQCEGIITKFAPWRELQWTFKGTHKQKHWQVTESYLLTEKAGCTRLVRTVDLTHTPIPTLLRPLIWIILRFGRSVGPTAMQQLKALAEPMHQSSDDN